MDKRSLFVVLFLSSLVVLSGCTFSNYYEFEEGVFCLDKDKDELCDKDEPEELEIDPKKLFEFEEGKFCVDANDNKKCDDEEPKESITSKAVDNSTKDEIVEVEEIPDNSEKTDHELCLEKYDITSGTLIYRYSSWNPFKDDSFVNDLKEAGYDVYKDKIGTDVMETYDASNLMKECFAGKYSVKDFLPPEYICSSNKDVIKDPNYSDLRVFAEDCKDANVI
ncbi:MAG: hypothetical protein J4472_02165 [DPANN group archaeon]|nr:hypothetical protein [DPANN group archaeon]